MRFAYADPPYPGCAHRYPEKQEVDHPALLARLSEYDGWALSTGSHSLAYVLSLCPSDVRIGSWVKPFAVFRPNVNPAYAWEPVIFRGSRKRSRQHATVRDWVSCNITLKKGLVGAKPDAVCDWILDFLGLEAEDTLDDLYPGTGAMGRAVVRRKEKLASEDREAAVTAAAG